MADAMQDNAVAVRILKAASKLFARRGYAATSMREVAEEAGITKPMLYYYYQNKDGLCRATIEHSVNVLCERVRVASDARLDPRERLVEFFWQHFAYFREYPDVCRLCIHVAFGPDEEVPGVDLEALYAPLSDAILRFIDEACESGLIRSDRKVQMERAVKGIILVTSFDVLEKCGGPFTREHAMEIVDNLLYGFADRNHSSDPRTV